ncbi:membrane protein [Betaproteobacteria bacterium]|nr:membrane protein [Betaproteobacteria bacterium]
MQLKLPVKFSENSLFAILLRSSWWISFAIAGGLLILVRLFIPEEYLVPASSLALPFIAIGGYVAWKQAKLPGAARVEETVEAVNAMSWKEFSALMEQAFVREGYSVTRLAGPADFKLVKMGKRTLVYCKRWKAASHGLEPLLELEKQREEEDAHEALYVALGGLSDNARGFFTGKRRVRLVEGLELTSLLRLPRKGIPLRERFRVK